MRKFKWVLDSFRCTDVRYVNESSDVRFVGAERFVYSVLVDGWYRCTCCRYVRDLPFF